MLFELEVFRKKFRHLAALFTPQSLVFEDTGHIRDSECCSSHKQDCGRAIGLGFLGQSRMQRGEYFGYKIHQLIECSRSSPSRRVRYRLLYLKVLRRPSSS